MVHRYVGAHRLRRRRRGASLSGLVAIGILVAALVVLVPGELTVEASGARADRPSSVRPATPIATRTPEAPFVDRFDVLAAGDLLIHAPIYHLAQRAGGYDFRPMLAAIRPIVSRAALALCHLETPIGPGPPPAIRSSTPRRSWTPPSAGLGSMPATRHRITRWTEASRASTPPSTPWTGRAWPMRVPTDPRRPPGGR